MSAARNGRFRLKLPAVLDRTFRLEHLATRRGLARRVAVAVVLPVLAGYLTLAARGFAERNIFMLTFLAVAGAGVYGGFFSGALATTVAGLFSIVELLPPTHSILVVSTQDRLRLLALFSSGLIISLLSELLHHAVRQVLSREAALRESEESYRALFATLTELVFIVDLRGHFIASNPAVERVLGYTPAELDGTSLEGLTSSADASPLLRSAMEGALAGVPQQLEWWPHRRNREPLPTELTLTRGQYRGRMVLIAVARDVSQRKAAEAALAASQERLQHAQKMEAVGRLAGGIAHDFNNLLTAIKGNAELAAHDLPPACTACHELREISAIADRGAGLTRQLLAFSRKQAQQPRLIDLNVLLLEMERMLRRVLRDDIALSLETAREPAWVRVDAAQLEQVVLNLVVNARDALTHGGRITAAVTNGPSSGNGSSPVVLSIADNGEGIPSEIMDRIFEPFFTTKAPGSGTGLGLSMVYGIVHENGGDVQVSSSPGTGTCVRVLLPGADAPPPHR